MIFIHPQRNSILDSKQKKRAIERAKNRPPQEQKSLVAALKYSGPLPPPDLLCQYSNAVPDGAERIMRMAEREQSHRHEITVSLTNNESILIKSEAQLSLAGQIFAFLFAMSALACSTVVAIYGHPTAGTIIGTGTVAAVVYAFVSGRRKKN